MGIKFKAHLWKISRDHTDEVTLILKIPSSDAITVIGLPTEKVFNIEVTSEEER
jgi:hypothetical protein